VRFISIPGSIAVRKNLSATDKLVYGVLRYHQAGQAECWPSQAHVAQAIGCSVRAVGTSIKRLEAAGLVTIQRRFKQSNAYRVQLVQDPTYLRVPDSILAADAPALHKLIMAALGFKARNEDSQAWPHQDTLATELGCSRSSIVRALNELEAAGKIQVKHRGGGRKRGNVYRLKAGFYSATVEHGRPETVSKVPNRKINNSEDSKRTGAVQGIPAAGLSPSCRPAESPPAVPKPRFGDPPGVPGAPQERREQAVHRLVGHGVHRTVATAIVFDQHHPPDSVQAAIDNAILRQALHRAKGLDRLKPFNLPGYIVGSLNRARKEAHVVKASTLLEQARARHEQRQAWSPLPADDFEERRRRCIEGLRRAAS
jgi:biotin operon repressor